MTLLRLAEYGGGLVEVWAEIAPVGDLVGLTIVNGSDQALALAVRRADRTWHEVSSAKGMTTAARLLGADAVPLVEDAPRRRWDGLHLALMWPVAGGQ